MKILIVTGGFFPGVKCGGPPVSVNNFCTLMRDDECYVVAKNHDMGESEPYKNIHSGWNDRGNCKVKYLSDSEYGMKGFADAMDEILPDVLYLQSLFADCIIPCLALAKKRNIPVLLAPRGELCPGAMKKKYKKLPYILFLRMSGLARNVSFQSTSEDELEGIKKYFGDNVRCYSLTNVPSMPSENFSHPEKKAGEARLVFLSRIVPKKNLMYALSCLENAQGKIKFDIYGPIEDRAYFEQCMAAAEKLPNNVSVKYKGLVASGEASSIFSQYDAFVFPTFSENYGHVIAESLSAGCPVFTSDQTPWNFKGFMGAGASIPLDSKHDYEERIAAILQADERQMKIYRNDASSYFKSTASVLSLLDRYQKALTEVVALNEQYQ